MMRKIYLSILLVAAISFAAACGGTEPANNAAANTNANANGSSHPPMNTVRPSGGAGAWDTRAVDDPLYADSGNWSNA